MVCVFLGSYIWVVEQFGFEGKILEAMIEGFELDR
jgi:hypothetical protein